MKYRIPKNTVQETLMIPLYARKLCTERFPRYFSDESAAQVMQKTDFDFSPFEEKSDSPMHVFGALEVAMRQRDIACEIKKYLEKHPRAAVVNLGCGLDNTGRSCDNGSCRICNLDLPDVIKMRNALLPAGEREENIACDLNDFSWMKDIDAADGAIFYAAGVFYYFRTEQMQKLTAAMAEHFPGGRLVFDTCGPFGVKLMLKTWVKQAGIKDVGAYFSLKDLKEIEARCPRIKAGSRPYMRGYTRFGKDIPCFYRFLSYIGDEWIGMKIVSLDFLPA